MPRYVDVPFDVPDLAQVFHLTINFSSRLAAATVLPPFLTMRSDIISNLTFPRSGRRPHANGAVHRAAT